MPRSIGLVGPHVIADVEQQRQEAASVQAETRRSDDWREIAFAYRTIIQDFAIHRTICADGAAVRMRCVDLRMRELVT